MRLPHFCPYFWRLCSWYDVICFLFSSQSSAVSWPIIVQYYMNHRGMIGNLWQLLMERWVPRTQRCDQMTMLVVSEYRHPDISNTNGRFMIHRLGTRVLSQLLRRPRPRPLMRGQGLSNQSLIQFFSPDHDWNSSHLFVFGCRREAEHRAMFVDIDWLFGPLLLYHITEVRVK